MKPYEHAKNSAKKFGGKAEDYLDIHDFMDSSKSVFQDLRHRAATHNSWFIYTVIPRVFGEERTNSAGGTYSTRDVAEQHVNEDFDMLFIPTLQDFLQGIPAEDWMDNARGGALPPSAMALKEVGRRRPTKRKNVPKVDVTKIPLPDESVDPRPMRRQPRGHSPGDCPGSFIVD